MTISDRSPDHSNVWPQKPIQPEGPYPARPFDEYLDITEIAARAGISVAEIRRRTAQGDIKPALPARSRLNPSKKHFYVIEQVETLRALQTRLREKPITPTTKITSGHTETRYSGEQAQKVFKLLETGRTLRQCIIETGCHPVVVETLADVWAKLDNTIFISSIVADQIHALGLDTSGRPATASSKKIQTGDDIYQALKKLSESSRCNTCGRRACAVCNRCAAKIALAAKHEERERLLLRRDEQAQTQSEAELETDLEPFQGQPERNAETFEENLENDFADEDP